MKTAKKMAEQLRSYAAHPAGNGYVPMGPTTLLEVANLLDPAGDPARRSGPYRVERDTSDGHCMSCDQDCPMWTIVTGQGDNEIGIGQSWGNKETALDICELMNMAASDAEAAVETPV